MRKKGFTLLEAIISLFLLTTIISLISLYQFNTTQLLKETKLKRLVEMQMAIGLDEISRDVKEATRIIDAEEHRLTFQSSHFGLRHQAVSQNEERMISYFIGVFNQSLSHEYELPKYGLMRSENYHVQPVVYYFGDSPSSLMFSYFDQNDHQITDQSEIHNIAKIKVEVDTTTLKFKQKIHKETTVYLNRGI